MDGRTQDSLRCSYRAEGGEAGKVCRRYEIYRVFFVLLLSKAWPRRNEPANGGCGDRILNLLWYAYESRTNQTSARRYSLVFVSVCLILMACVVDGRPPGSVGGERELLSHVFRVYS